MATENTASVRVDYFTFSIPLSCALVGTNVRQAEQAFEIVRGALALSPPCPTEAPFVPSRGARFYAQAWTHVETGTRIQFGGSAETVLVEMSGRVCDHFRSAGMLDAIIERWQQRTTRIDIAVDYASSVAPEAFAAFRNDVLYKHLSVVRSDAGTTCYIGSRKSSRMARVYRYAPPHPRSDLLRVEIECKGDYAKRIAALYATEGLLAAAGAANTPFSWSHPVATAVRFERIKLSAPSATRHASGTVRWLYTDVCSAIRRLVRSGEFDLEEWLAHVNRE